MGGAPAAAASEMVPNSPSSVVYDGFAALQASQEAARSAGRAALQHVSRPPSALTASPLPPGVETRPEYGRCVLAACNLPRISKVSGPRTGANHGRIFLTCPESQPNNLHNGSFVWRDVWYKHKNLPLLQADVAWIAYSRATVQALQRGMQPPPPPSFSQAPTQRISTPPQQPQ